MLSQWGIELASSQVLNKSKCGIAQFYVPT